MKAAFTEKSQMPAGGKRLRRILLRALLFSLPTLIINLIVQSRREALRGRTANLQANGKDEEKWHTVQK